MDWENAGRIKWKMNELEFIRGKLRQRGNHTGELKARQGIITGDPMKSLRFYD